MSNLRQVYLNLWVGDDEDCQNTFPRDQMAVVHACKTCHQRALNYRGSLPKAHPEYLVAKREEDLYLNMIDSPDPHFFPPTLFRAAVPFIRYHLEYPKKVLVHCNHGYSRSPSVALYYLAKMGIIDSSTYAAAIKDYEKLDPDYSPGHGIWAFLTDNWGKV